MPLAKSVRRANGDRKGVDTGLAYEACSLVGSRKSSTLLLAELGDISELRLYIHAVRTGHLHHATRGLHILLERSLARVNHHGVETCIKTTLHKFNRAAVVEVYPSADTVVGYGLTGHRHGLTQAHILYRTARKLEKGRRVGLRSGLHHRRQRLEIVEICGKDRTMLTAACCKKFLYVHIMA